MKFGRMPLRRVDSIRCVQRPRARVCTLPFVPTDSRRSGGSGRGRRPVARVQGSIARTVMKSASSRTSRCPSYSRSSAMYRFLSTFQSYCRTWSES